MDSGRCSIYSNGTVVYIAPGSDGNGSGNWGLGSTDQAVWATEDDYGDWNTDASVDGDSNFDRRQIQTGSGSEPSNKKLRISQLGDVQPTNRPKVMAEMFYKTKLCYKFRDGTCPYITNCNFAHSIEELRRLPPNWQELIASYEEVQAATELREESQIPSQSSFRGRPCKHFLSTEGCPYGDYCVFLHDEQARDRESVTISLGPGSRDKYGGGVVSPSALKPVLWKTRICNMWQTGNCSYGDKCNFAHGTTELQGRGGGLLETECKDFSSPLDAKQKMVSLKSPGSTKVASPPSLPYAETYHRGVSLQRVSNVRMAGQTSHQKWKGSDKISLIYGDWFEDLV